MSEKKKEGSAAVTAHNWFETFLHSYAAELGYVFLLSGNIADLFPLDGEFVTLRQYWARRLAGREIVVFWDKSAGFGFADEIMGMAPAAGELPMREKFKAAVGLGAQPSQNGNNASNLLAGLAGIGGGNAALPTDPEQAFQLLEMLLSQGKPGDKKAAVVVEYVESVLPENDYTSTPAVTLQRWASLDSPLKGTGNPVVLIERNPERASSVVKHDDSSVVRIHIPRPSREELEAFIRHSLKNYGVKLASGLSIEVAGNLCAGLRCRDFEDFCMRSLESGEAISDQFIWSKKIALIEAQSEGVLRVVRPKHGFEAVGGLDHVKRALSVQIEKLRRGDPTTAQGAGLTGPPGTGKTILAEALATESGVNLCMLGNVLSKFVGDSERNMRLALDIARAMAPTIIFIDEAAEAIGSGNEYAGDSGVSNRVRGMLQNAMGDTRGEVFFVLATNYPERLPAAVRRPGRIDLWIPLLPPDAAGRKSILEALCRKYGFGVSGLDFSAAVAATDRWTGAQLEALLLCAKQLAEEAGRTKGIETADLSAALEDYIPARDAQAEDLMVAQALRHTTRRSLLPPEYRGRVADVQADIDRLEPVIADREARRRGKLSL